MTLRPTGSLVFSARDGVICCAKGGVVIEMTGDAVQVVDAELIRHVANGVLHYFREELGREKVSVAEFASAFTRALRGLGIAADEPEESAELAVVEADLGELAGRVGEDSELFFFPRVKQEVLRCLSDGPGLVRLTGLRPCVKRLTGARRWTARCQELNDRIVEFLRCCLAESDPMPRSALLVL